MSFNVTIFISLSMFACMCTVFASRVDSNDGIHKQGCVPVRPGLGSSAIGATDIVLEAAAGAISGIIKSASGWDMSHAMMVVEAKKESVSIANQQAAIHVWIAESVGEGVKGRWLWNALHDAKHFRIYRPHCGPEYPAEEDGECSNADWRKVVSFLEYHVGHSYSVSRLAEAGAGKIWDDFVPTFFDQAEDPCPSAGSKSEHPTDFMCSELVWNALRQGGFLPYELQGITKGVSPEHLERCAFNGERKGAAHGNHPQVASLFAESSYIPWHSEMSWEVSEPQPCLGKDKVISFLKAAKLDRRMTFSHWASAAEAAGHPHGPEVQVGSVVKAKHAAGLFEDDAVKEADLSEVLDAFLILELTQDPPWATRAGGKCKTGNYLFLYGVGEASPKLESSEALFCQ